MTSTVVKRFAESLVAQVVPEAPYQNTIGQLTDTKNLPEIWSTLEYADAGSQRLTVGTPALWREFGTIVVVLVGKAGFGPKPLEKLGEKIFNTVQDMQRKLTEPETGITGTLRIQNVSPPNGDDYEDGNWLQCSVSCVYTYDSVRGAAA